VTTDLANADTTPSWRDIPQPVKPRAMSPGGRRRLRRGTIRTAGVVVFVGLLAWGGWQLTAELRQQAGQFSRVVDARPVRAAELRTNGTLTAASIAHRLALPPGASLMDLDLEQLRARLVADGQIEAATLTRHFPDRLLVTLTERSPVAKLMANWKGYEQVLLVARDGVVFVGEGLEGAVIDRLPWLDGITLTREGGGFKPVAGMNVVADLLARVRETETRAAASDPRRMWRVVSLGRLAADRELEVQTVAGSKLIFSANGDFLRQLAKLDYVWDALVNAPSVPARIDLTLGREVPVMAEPPPPPTTPNSIFSQSKARREF
jgi:cell division protein FtsQ